MAKEKSKLLQNEEFIKGLEIVDLYLQFFKEEKENRETKIAELNEQIVKNIQTSEEILKDFHLVKFIERDRQLYIQVPEKPDIFFRVDSLQKRQNNVAIINMLQKRINKYSEELVIAESKENEIRKKIEELSPAKIKKILGIFSNKKEENKANIEYNKELKKLKRDLESAEHNTSTIKLQLDANQNILNSIKETREYISKLSKKDKNSILEHYELIKHLFDENENLYKEMRVLEKEQKTALTLDSFVKIHLSDEEKELFDKMIQSLNNEYGKVRVVQKNLSDRPKVLKLRDLASEVDFGQYKNHIKFITSQMVDNENTIIPSTEIYEVYGPMK